jgi:hypothetical protein
VSEDRPGSARREPAAVLGAVLVAAGGILLAVSQPWLRVTVNRPAPFPPVVADITGRTEFSGLPGLAVVALIIPLLVLISGGWARRVLGVLLAIVGASCAWDGVRGLRLPGTSRLVELAAGTRTGASIGAVHRHLAWPLVTVVCGSLVLLAGIAVLMRADRWKIGLSRRYSAPAELARSEDAWRSLDRGEDPTIDDR